MHFLGMSKALLAAASALLVAGCATYDPPGARYPAGPYPDAGYYPPPGSGPPGDARCPIMRSGNWKAWINRMPGPDARPKLIITGDVVTSSAGYKVEFDPSLKIRESYPAQAVAVLQVTPPAGMAAQVVETHQVRWEWPVRQQIGSLDIVCRGETLARIPNVESAY